MNKHRTVGNIALANCLGRLNIYTDEEDVETDFQDLVAGCLNGFFYNHQQGFRYNPSQCNNLCHAFIAKLSKYFANNWNIRSSGKKVRFTRNTKCVLVSDDRDKKVLERAWKEIYRVVKEAQIYLQDCSNRGMKSITSSIGGEAYAVHIHNLVWSLICLDLNYSYLQKEKQPRFTETSYRKINDFYAEMSQSTRIHDEYHKIFHQLLKACEMGDDEVPTLTVEERNNLGIEKFLSAKLQATILGEPAVIGNRVCSWLQIDSKDLIPKQRLIGEGNFGKVYQGSWLGVKVAVKEIPLFEGDMDYLATEIAVHAKLHSPFVVQLIGICITNTHCYFVMELANSSLDKILKDRSKGQMAPLALPVAVDMMLQISMGMEYLHSQKIMHMDLKASNVVIQPSTLPEFRDHGYGRVKMCDFGDASLRLSSFRYPEDTKGACKWRAPEVFSYAQQENLEIEMNGPTEYTYKADVYSFAMTCFEILTGKYPFEDVVEKEILGMVVRDIRPSLPPSCPSVLADFIKNCWDTDPNRRPCFADISNFMRSMKLFIMRIEDSSDLVFSSAVWRDFDTIQLVKCESNEEEGSDDRVPGEEGIHRCLSQKRAQHSAPKINVLFSLPHYIQQYSYEDMQNATDNFSVKVGEVSCLMWKGTMSDGSQVSVKKQRLEMSLTEISILCQMHHPNAVHLRGISAGDEACLAFDHMVMGSLAAKLFFGKSILNWNRRRKIGLGIARFLAYLHNDHMPRVLNLQINASNVYLDEQFSAKLGDFESIIMPTEGNSESLSLALQFEEFRNVQDFGVILLELLTGHRWENMEYSLQSINESIHGRRSNKVIRKRLLDRALEGKVDVGEAMVKIALWCFVRFPWQRPKMNKIFAAMEGLCEVSLLPTNQIFESYRRGQREYITSKEEHSNTKLSKMWCVWNDMTVSKVSSQKDQEKPTKSQQFTKRST